MSVCFVSNGGIIATEPRARARGQKQRLGAAVTTGSVATITANSKSALSPTGRAGSGLLHRADLPRPGTLRRMPDRGSYINKNEHGYGYGCPPSWLYRDRRPCS